MQLKNPYYTSLSSSHCDSQGYQCKSYHKLLYVKSSADKKHSDILKNCAAHARFTVIGLTKNSNNNGLRKYSTVDSRSQSLTNFSLKILIITVGAEGTANLADTCVAYFDATFFGWKGSII